MILFALVVYTTYRVAAAVAKAVGALLLAALLLTVAAVQIAVGVAVVVCGALFRGTRSVARTRTARPVAAKPAPRAGTPLPPLMPLTVPPVVR